MLRFPVSLAVAIAFGLGVFAVPSRQTTFESSIRTIPLSEARSLIGADGGRGYECELIEECEEVTGVTCDDIVVINGNIAQASMQCSQSSENVLRIEAGKEQCVPGAPQTMVCTQYGLNACNLKYMCRWDAQALECKQGIHYDTVYAPAECVPEIFPLP